MRKETIHCDLCGKEVYDSDKPGYSYWVLSHQFQCGQEGCLVYHIPTKDAVWCSECMIEQTESEYNKK